MSRTRTPSFVYELPLQTDPEESNILDMRLNMARQLYNAILGEVLRCIGQMKQSSAYQRALRMSKGAARTRAFNSLWEKYHLSDHAIQAMAIKHKNACCIGEKLDTHVCQKIGTRVFEAVEPYLFGKRGKPRFKGYGRFRSVEGKSNASGIRWRAGKVCWNGLTLKACFDLKDKHDVESHALACRVKYLRLVRHIIRGNIRWFVQLILEGRPKIKHPISTQRVGLDVGPSSLALYHPEKAGLQAFCANLAPQAQKLKNLQRKMARSRRLNNPKKSSKRYRCLRAIHTEIYRQAASTRKKLHGTLVNEILGLGNHIYTEKLSYKAWQKRFGRSVGLRAPGKFISHLRDKAERAGGQLVEFGTFHTRLSQTCHCGQQKKKSLAQRWHSCDCGVGPVQRDLYSAYLAYHIEDNRLDINQAQKAWSGAEALLERAMSKLNEIAKGQSWLASFGLNQRWSDSHVKERSTVADVLDVVS